MFQARIRIVSGFMKLGIILHFRCKFIETNTKIIIKIPVFRILHLIPFKFYSSKCSKYTLKTKIIKVAKSFSKAMALVHHFKSISGPTSRQVINEQVICRLFLNKFRVQLSCSEILLLAKLWF
jgi:hypothetical protein